MTVWRMVVFFSGFRWAEGDGLLTSTIRRQDLNSLWRLAVETKKTDLDSKGWGWKGEMEGVTKG